MRAFFKVVDVNMLIHAFGLLTLVFFLAHIASSHDYPDHQQQQNSKHTNVPTIFEKRWVQHDLPSPPEPFIGRDKELEEIVALLITENKKDIISINGPPAFGKSALAIHVGHTVLKLDIDVRYVDTSESQLFQWINENVQTSSEVIMPLQRESTTSLIESNSNMANSFIEWIRSLKHTTLLILDNLDEVLALKINAFQKYILKLQKSAPLHKLKVLMTSQTHVTFLDRFQQYIIGELQPEAAVQLLNKLAYIEIDSHSHRLVEIAGFCPLTIKVIAALLNKPNMYGSDWLLAELEHRLPSTSCLDETLAHSECWKAIMDVAYSKLSNETQICGHYVSLFPGSFDDEAKWNILTPQISKCPMKLIFSSLLERFTFSNTTRYKMHKLIREYFKSQKREENIFPRFETDFLSHYISLAFKLVQLYTMNTDQVQDFIFDIDSHNWKELVVLTLNYSNQEPFKVPKEDTLIIVISFLHYKHYLPHTVSWHRLFILYNTPRFISACQLLGEKECLGLLIQTIEHIQEELPPVSCSLLSTFDNRDLINRINTNISTSLCYCETHIHFAYYFFYIPYIFLFAKCCVDLIAIFLYYLRNLSTDNYVMRSSQAITAFIFDYITISGVISMILLNPLTKFLCYIINVSAFPNFLLYLGIYIIVFIYLYYVLYKCSPRIIIGDSFEGLELTTYNNMCIIMLQVFVFVMHIYYHNTSDLYTRNIWRVNYIIWCNLIASFLVLYIFEQRFNTYDITESNKSYYEFVKENLFSLFYIILIIICSRYSSIDLSSPYNFIIHNVLGFKSVVPYIY